MAELPTSSKDMLAATQLTKLTLGNSDFPMIRKKGSLFVDKTAKISHLLDFDKVFFSRPRRFGKTTLTSMLFELFMHGTKKFKGLAVYDTWPETQCYPTISITLYGLQDPETFEADFCHELCKALNEAGLSDLYERTKHIDTLAAFFVEVQGDLGAVSTVWLIDEVDYPLAANLNNPDAFAANSKVLHKFFVTLRALKKVHFMFVTGIMRSGITLENLMLPAT